MKVLVCGGRDYQDFDKMSEVLRNLDPDVVVCGAARGADRLAKLWAEFDGTECREYPAEWKTHGRVAGVIRNQQMLDNEKIDLVVAFPGGRGTADMVRRAEAAGVPVQFVL